MKYNYLLMGSRLIRSSKQFLREQRGVNFSRIQIEDVFIQSNNGCLVEFETLGPYLVNYIAYNGTMTFENLAHEDAIGLELAVVLRRIFPDARLISLYDEYNTAINNHDQTVASVAFTDNAKTNFKDSLIALFEKRGIISSAAGEEDEFLLLAESSRVKDAEAMTDLLEQKGHIRRHKGEFFFVNDKAENPKYRQIKLKTKNRWLCVALDAAAFLKVENLSIVHIVVLPAYMEEQQDQVWEIVRILGITSDRYHNIFYDVDCSPTYIASIVERKFQLKNRSKIKTHAFSTKN